MEFIVRATGSSPDFDFDSFEGPGAPNLDKQLVEFKTESTRSKDVWKVAVAGWYGGNGEGDAFVFSPSTLNKTDQTVRIAKAVSSGEVVLTAIAHDSRRWDRTLEATFPKLDPSSEAASVLNGCRTQPRSASR